MNDKKLINIRASNEFIKNLKEAAKDLEVSVSHFVREAVKQKIKTMKAGNGGRKYV